jgi:hypothetical protein
MGASCTYRALGGAHGREVDQVGEVLPLVPVPSPGGDHRPRGEDLLP